MQFNVSTDYAIRVVFYLALIKDKVYAKELGDTLGIPKSFVYKVTKKLQEADIIGCEVGAKGGYKLVKLPEEITLHEIINLMEPTTRINRCLEEDEYCSRYATENCPVRKFYVGMQSTVERMLNDITIAELIEEQS